MTDLNELEALAKAAQTEERSDPFLRPAQFEYIAALSPTVVLSLIAAARERRWVPVSERLPECGEPYLLYLSSKGIVRQGFRTSGKLWFLDDGDPALAVTHWMPLPKGPTNGR